MEDTEFKATFEISETKGKGKNAITTTTLYRRLTPDEMKNLVQGRKVKFITRFNEVREFKVTSVKTWKTRLDVDVKVKYGLYQYSNSFWSPESGHVGEILVREVNNER